jgi:hypothetical protein
MSALLTSQKTKKLPARVAHPYIRDRGHLVGSFA